MLHKANNNCQDLSKGKITARSAALQILYEVLEKGAYTNLAVSNFLRRHALPDLERRFLTELVYGTVKVLGTLQWYLIPCLKRPLAKLDKKLAHIFYISLFQLLYLKKIPASAAVNEAVELARAASGETAADFVNAVLRSFLRRLTAREFTLPDEESDSAGYLALKYAHPRWLVKRWLGVYGKEDSEKLLAFNNMAAPLCLRVNTLLTSRSALTEELRQLGVEVRFSLWCEDGLVCAKMPALNSLSYGLLEKFYIQDESAMLAAGILKPTPGETLLDMCSAPGGKATHLAQLMKNQGKLIACDIYRHKLKLIEENAERLGIKIIETALLDATKAEEKLVACADKVLCDVPCSGLGVLRRRAEARWRKTRADLKSFPPLQLQILENAANYVKAGGKLLYSTCTIEQSENHYLVAEFLRRRPEWEYAGMKHPLTGADLLELQLLPQCDGIDGSYFCLLQRCR